MASGEATGSGPEAPTLVLLAAGMGSRYGGLKQLEPVGPGGEILLDYSVRDARQAGFGRVIFVIRRELEADFEAAIGGRLRSVLPVEYAFQQLDDLPAGFRVPAGRAKPWGTGHAVLAARELLRGPFCVVNADDFYGPSAFAAMARGLAEIARADCLEAVIVAYRLRNTLSEHGPVSRGVCTLDDDGRLAGIDERLRVEATGDGARYRAGDGSWHGLTGEEPTSINFWGFPRAIVPLLEVRFAAFLEANGHDPKAEFFLPTAVSDLVAAGALSVRVRLAEDRWLGITHPDDREPVREALAALVRAGVYPERLWS